MRKIVTLGLLLAFLMLSFIGVKADELDDINKQINELSSAREQSVAATKPLEGELGRLEDKLAGIEAGIEKAKAELRALEASIVKREKDFANQYVLLAERALSFYKSSRAPSSLFVLFSKGGLVRDLFYSQVVTDRDKDEIAGITAELIDLEKDKKKAEEDRVRLADLQVKLDKEADFFRGEIAGAKAYQAKLSQQIATLSAKQQSIIAQKLSSLNLPQSLGAGPLVCTDDRKLDPGFGNAYAFYTYGIPHRVGMNQYGAYGRAKAGKSTDEILHAYFNFDFQTGKEGESVIVNGTNEFGQTFSNESMNIEEYLKHLHEMPSGWDAKALQAQAIAARSYALRIMQDAGSLRPSQADQVIKKELNAQSWIDAVEATKGKIMTEGGRPIKAWYSSTDGGYTFSSADVWGGSTGWTKGTRDTSGEVSSFGDLNDRAYDKESKCFYAAQGWRNEYGKSAWLKGEEVADIANVILLVRKDSSNRCFVYQVDKSPPSPDNECPQTGNWSVNEVKQKLGSEAISSASSVEISGVNWGSGRVTQVKINGISFDGNEFKNWFNLRAPANIQIVGPLYNVEKK